MRATSNRKRSRKTHKGVDHHNIMLLRLEIRPVPVPVPLSPSVEVPLVSASAASESSSAPSSRNIDVFFGTNIDARFLPPCAVRDLEVADDCRCGPDSGSFSSSSRISRRAAAAAIDDFRAVRSLEPGGLLVWVVIAGWEEVDFS